MTYYVPLGSEFDGTLEGFEIEFVSRGGQGSLTGTGWLTVDDKPSADIAQSMGCLPDNGSRY